MDGDLTKTGELNSLTMENEDFNDGFYIMVKNGKMEV